MGTLQKVNSFTDHMPKRFGTPTIPKGYRSTKRVHRCEKVSNVPKGSQFSKRFIMYQKVQNVPKGCKSVTRRELKFLTRAFLLCYFIFDIFHMLISHYISHFISHYISFVIIMCLQDIYLYSLLFH